MFGSVYLYWTGMIAYNSQKPTLKSGVKNLFCNADFYGHVKSI